jgi:hypothetical protein
MMNAVQLSMAPAVVAVLLCRELLREKIVFFSID